MKAARKGHVHILQEFTSKNVDITGIVNAVSTYVYMYVCIHHTIKKMSTNVLS